MGNDEGGRKILWWRMPVSPDASAEVGKRMMRSNLVWFAVVLVVVAIIAAIVIIA